MIEATEAYKKSTFNRCFDYAMNNIKTHIEEAIKAHEFQTCVDIGEHVPLEVERKIAQTIMNDLGYSIELSCTCGHSYATINW